MGMCIVVYRVVLVKNDVFRGNYYISVNGFRWVCFTFFTGHFVGDL